MVISQKHGILARVRYVGNVSANTCPKMPPTVGPKVIENHPLRRTRRNGLLGMAQPLKSFRDAKHSFPPYAKGAVSRTLESLGDLEMPGVGTKKSRSETDLSVPRIAQGG